MEILATLHCTRNSMTLGHRKWARVALEITTQKTAMANSQTFISKFITFFFNYNIKYLLFYQKDKPI